MLEQYPMLIDDDDITLLQTACVQPRAAVFVHFNTTCLATWVGRSVGGTVNAIWCMDGPRGRVIEALRTVNGGEMHTERERLVYCAQPTWWLLLVATTPAIHPNSGRIYGSHYACNVWKSKDKGTVNRRDTEKCLDCWGSRGAAGKER